MKKLMTIFGAFFFASVVLTSCGDVNVEDLDKDIESEEDAVEAMLTLGEAQLDLIVSLKGSVQEVADLKDRFEKIQESSEDVYEQIEDEDLDWEDIIEDGDMEDMADELEDAIEDLEDLLEDCDYLNNLMRLAGGGRDDVYDDYDRGKVEDIKERRGSGYRSSGSASGSAASAASEY